MTSYQKQCLTLLDLILNEDYYVRILMKVLSDRNVEMNEFFHADNISDEEYCMFWNDFWAELPDVPEIHRSPFNFLCDMCENE